MFRNCLSLVIVLAIMIVTVGAVTYGSNLRGDARGNTPRSGEGVDEFRWNGRIKSGKVVEINGILGNIQAEPTDGDELQITAIKHGSKDNPKDIEIQVLEHEGGITVCAIYPSQDPARPCKCQPGSLAKQGSIETDISGNRASIQFPGGAGGDILLTDVNVDFTVRVPSGVRFIGRTVKGNVRVGETSNAILAQAVYGDVSAD